MNTLQVSEENAPKFLEWLRTRGGLSVWVSKDIGGDCGASVTTPYKDANGNVNTAPHWKHTNTPERVITDPADVEVCIDKPVESFEIKFKTSGHRLVLHAASQRKLGAALARAGENAYYVFGEKDGPNRIRQALCYGCDTCTIMKTEQVIPLLTWEALKAA
jgi:hypothetical protein